MRLYLDPALKSVLFACAEELDDLGADWAIGGATAMQAHGYARATRDVDLFVGDDARLELLARLRARAIPVKAIFSPHHYRIAPAARKDPEASVDLLFPALGVESLGLMAARRTPVEGTKMPVVPLHHLVALKLTTDPGIDPSRYLKDQADLVALRDRGLVDALRVGQILEDVNDPEARTRLTELVAGHGRGPRVRRAKGPRSRT
jgi:hypothetical protein